MNPRGSSPTRFPVVRTRPNYATSPKAGVSISFSLLLATYTLERVWKKGAKVAPLPYWGGWGKGNSWLPRLLGEGRGEGYFPLSWCLCALVVKYYHSPGANPDQIPLIKRIRYMAPSPSWERVSAGVRAFNRCPLFHTLTLELSRVNHQRSTSCVPLAVYNSSNPWTIRIYFSMRS